MTGNLAIHPGSPIPPYCRALNGGGVAVGYVGNHSIYLDNITITGFPYVLYSSKSSLIRENGVLRIVRCGSVDYEYGDRTLDVKIDRCGEVHLGENDNGSTVSVHDSGNVFASGRSGSLFLRNISGVAFIAYARNFQIRAENVRHLRLGFVEDSSVRVSGSAIMLHRPNLMECNSTHIQDVAVRVARDGEGVREIFESGSQVPTNLVRPL